MAWKLTAAAEMVWQQLRPPHRTQIRRALDRLVQLHDIDDDSHVRTIRAGGHDEKVLRTTGYEIFFKQDQREIVVLDIATKAQIEFFRPKRVSTAA